jgi:hypothetical protein
MREQGELMGNVIQMKDATKAIGPLDASTPRGMAFADADDTIHPYGGTLKVGYELGKNGTSTLRLFCTTGKQKGDTYSGEWATIGPIGIDEADKRLWYVPSKTHRQAAVESKQPKPEPKLEKTAREKADDAKLIAFNREKGKQEAGRSIATDLVEMATSQYRLGVATDGEPFAVLKDGPNIVIWLRGSNDSLRAKLARQYHVASGNVPSQNALAEALNVIEGTALEAEPEEVFLRVADYEGSVVLDLGGKDGQCVVVTADGWSIEEHSPVPFRRTKATLPLPVPVRSKDGLTKLRKLMNVSDKSWDVWVGFQVSTFFPRIPHVIVLMVGEPGAAKTTAAKVSTLLIDPSGAPVRSTPKNLDDWQVSASASYVIAIDNLSSLNDWFSDALCRAATGEGLVKRTLFTNKDITLLEFRRMVILTAVELGSLRDDLADRLLLIELEFIPEEKRLRDTEVTRRFTEVHPYALGALLDLVVKVKKTLPSIKVDRLPRMADFAEILLAIDKVQGTYSFDTYRAQAADISGEIVANDRLIQAVITFMGSRAVGESWEGQPTHLFDNLTVRPTKENGFMRPPEDWPKAAAELSSRIYRAAPTLRHFGVIPSHAKSNGHRVLKLTKVTPLIPHLPGDDEKAERHIERHETDDPEEDYGKKLAARHAAKRSER